MTAFQGIAPVEKPENFRKISILINNMLLGKLNAVGTMTVANGTTTTTVDDRRTSMTSFIGLMALDANSADTSTFWCSSRDPLNNQFTFTHNSDGNDRHYTYVIIG